MTYIVRVTPFPTATMTPGCLGCLLPRSTCLYFDVRNYQMAMEYMICTYHTATSVTLFIAPISALALPTPTSHPPPPRTIASTRETGATTYHPPVSPNDAEVPR